MRRPLLGALLGTMAGSALPLASTAQIVSPPGLRVTIIPGAGMGGAGDIVQATEGPLFLTAANGGGGGMSNGSATVDYGSIRAETTTTLNATIVGGGLCLGSHCSSADAIWADTLTFAASGIPNGTTGSFTTEIDISGTLSGVFPPEFTLGGAASPRTTR